MVDSCFSDTRGYLPGDDPAWDDFWATAFSYTVLVGGNKTLILTSIASDPLITSIVNPIKTRYIREERHT